MADEIDRTQDRLELEEQIKRQYQPVNVEIKGTGRCLNCGENIDTSRRWCDYDCMKDYEIRREKCLM